MKNFILVALLIGLVFSENLPAQKNDQPDYFQYWNCDGTSNPIVQSVTFSFDCPPQVSVLDHIAINLTPKSNVYISQLTLSVKLLGVQLYSFTEDVGVNFPANTETRKGLWIPTDQAPGPMQITGELRLYNEFGDKVICWNYWMKILPAPPKVSMSPLIA